MKGPWLTRKAAIRGRANVFQYASVYARREPLQEKHLLKSRLGPLHRYGVEHLFMVIQNTRPISSLPPNITKSAFQQKHGCLYGAVGNVQVSLTLFVLAVIFCLSHFMGKVTTNRNSCWTAISSAGSACMVETPARNETNNCIQKPRSQPTWSPDRSLAAQNSFTF